MPKETTAYPHACPELREFMDEGKVGISYNPFAREYSIKLVSSPSTVQLIDYCPWCGTKLPEPLRDMWGDLLDAMEIFDPFGDDRARVPKEFWTDSWWKSRKL